jgi:hypothetical protein
MPSTHAVGHQARPDSKGRVAYANASNQRTGQDRCTGGIETVPVDVSNRGDREQHHEDDQQPPVQAGGRSQDAVHTGGGLPGWRDAGHRRTSLGTGAGSSINRSAIDP